MMNKENTSTGIVVRGLSKLLAASSFTTYNLGDFIRVGLGLHFLRMLSMLGHNITHLKRDKLLAEDKSGGPILQQTTQELWSDHYRHPH